MKLSLSIVFSIGTLIFTSVARADVSETVDSYKYLSNPDIEVLIDKAMPLLNTGSCRSNFRSYLKETKKAKAFAYTVTPNGKNGFCRSTRQKTQAIADRKAVELCNKRKKRSLPKCQLFASHHTLLIDIDNQVKPKSHDLFYAIDRLSLSSIRKIVESGANLKLKNNNHDTPFLHASRIARVDVMEYLITKGANVNDKDKSGYDALNLAAKKDSFKLFEYLLARGADINTVSKHTKLMPIHFAAQSKYGELKIIETILSKDGDINAQDASKRTALHYAAKNRRFTPLKYLIKNGADVNAKNTSGETPLDVAGDGRIEKYLIKHGGKKGTEI